LRKIRNQEVRLRPPGTSKLIFKKAIKDERSRERGTFIN